MTNKIVSAISLFLMTTVLSGCAFIPFIPYAGPAYEGYTLWRGSEAIKYYAYDLDTIYQAVKKSTKQMKLETTIQDLTSGNGYSIKTKGNIPMVLTLLPVERTVTKVVIEIASSEDKQYAELFYKTIDENIPPKAAGDNQKAK